MSGSSRRTEVGLCRRKFPRDSPLSKHPGYSNGGRMPTTPSCSSERIYSSKQRSWPSPLNVLLSKTVTSNSSIFLTSGRERRYSRKTTSSASLSSFEWPRRIHQAGPNTPCPPPCSFSLSPFSLFQVYLTNIDFNWTQTQVLALLQEKYSLIVAYRFDPSKSWPRPSWRVCSRRLCQS